MIKGVKSCAVALAVLFAASGQSHAFSLGGLMHGGSHGHSSGHSSGESGGKVTPQAVLQKLLAGPKDACGKGSVFSGKITIRSGNGMACKNRVVAAAATMLCGKRSDFAGSHCGQNAKRALAGQSPRAVLAEEAQKGGSLALSAAKKLGVMAHAKMTHKKHAAASVDNDEEMAPKATHKRKRQAAMHDDEDMRPAKKHHRIAKHEDEEMPALEASDEMDEIQEEPQEDDNQVTQDEDEDSDDDDGDD